MQHTKPGPGAFDRRRPRVDYTWEDFTRTGQRYDLYYCAIGNRSVFDYRRAESKWKVCDCLYLPLRLFEHMILGPLVSKRGDKKVGMMENLECK